MAEPKRPRTKRDKVVLTENELQVMKHLRFNVKSEEGKLQHSTVSYFTGSAIVDCLMRSKYATKAQPIGSLIPYYPDRKAAVAFLTRALQNGLFMRVEHRRRRTDREETEKSSKARKRTTATGNVDKSETSKDQEVEKEKEKEKKEDKKPKKTAKLLPHEVQIFADNDSTLFLWHYDPVRPRNVVLGALLVLGAILICLYPIWPRDMHVYTMYLSRVALALLGLLIGLILFRYVLVALVYVITFGRVTFWLFPNINDEKLGFKDSFKPVYTVTYNDSSKKEKEKSGSKKEGRKGKTEDAALASDDGKKKKSAKKNSSESSKSKKSDVAASSQSEPEDVASANVAETPLTPPSVADTAEQATTVPGDEEEEGQFEMINRDEL